MVWGSCYRGHGVGVLPENSLVRVQVSVQHNGVALHTHEALQELKQTGRSSDICAYNMESIAAYVLPLYAFAK